MLSSVALTELLLRDPDHPDVRALLLLRYKQVCEERALLQKVLKLQEQTRRERVKETTR